MEQYNILAVDDDKEILNSIEIFLQNENMNVFKASDGKEALAMLKKEEIHLILMDIMMPNMDGIQATLAIREKKDIPIIMLTAKMQDSDMVLGLNVGADDYITKPFNFLELVARVKSNIRRYVKYDNYKKEEDVIQIRGLTINKKTKEVNVNDKDIRLTALEFKILLLLAENKNVVFSIREIYEKVWDEDFYNSENTVSVHIRRIREKIEVNPKQPIYLKVVWGLGYKIDK